MINKARAALTKRQIKQRRKLLTKDGYDFIISAVQAAHSVTLAKRTVDAYLRGEKVHNTGKRRKDVYGIIPLYKAATDAEQEKRTRKAKQLSETLKP